ncbi:MAG: tetratricopeptide repeat protein [Pseudohongiellaceae bacterium]
MSLINDMLRDLDARRRDTPARGAGAEKLVPAADERQQGGSDRQQKWLMAAVILLAAAAGVAVALYLMATPRGGSDRSELPVARAPVQAESESQSGANDQAAQQLEALATRLTELEAENRRLQQKQAGSGPSSDSGNGEGQDEDGAATENPLTAANGQDDSRQSDWEARDWSAPDREEEAQTPSPAQRQMVDTAAPVSVPETANTTDEAATRTPREPSFAERDRRQVQDALTLWSDGRRTEALEALDQFTVDHPQAHLSREMLGKLLLQRGETGIATQVADIGLQIAPMHNGYRKLKARLLMAANQPGEALELLDNRPPSAEGDSEYHELLATAALASQQYRVARRSYENLLGTDDSEGRWWYGLATSLEGEGEGDNATRAYQRAQRSGSLSSRLRQRSEERIAQLTAP